MNMNSRLKYTYLCHRPLYHVQLTVFWHGQKPYLLCQAPDQSLVPIWYMWCQCWMCQGDSDQLHSNRTKSTEHRNLNFYCYSTNILVLSQAHLCRERKFIDLWNKVKKNKIQSHLLSRLLGNRQRWPRDPDKSLLYLESTWFLLLGKDDRKLIWQQILKHFRPIEQSELYYYILQRRSQGQDEIFYLVLLTNSYWIQSRELHT